MLESLIPMKHRDGVRQNTISTFRDFYCKVSPTSWPNIRLLANIKPWSFTEFCDILNRALRLTTEFGYGIATYSQPVLSKPPSQTYENTIIAARSGGSLEEARQADTLSYKQKHESWQVYKRTSPLTKEIYDSNNYLQFQIYVEGHEHDIKYPWWWMIKESPYHIHLNFYPNRLGLNEKVITEFCKFNPRYRLNGQIIFGDL